MNDSNDHERKQVAVSAFWVALGTATSRGLGFLRDMVIAHFFSRTSTDAFFLAFRLPNLFRRIFGEGALTVSFIPVLTDFLKNDDKKGARELTSAVFTLLFVVLSILTLLGTWGAGPVVEILTKGEGFSSIPGKMELSIHQTRIMFCYVMLVSLYAFGMGILNTLRIFWLPAVAPALWNITVICGVFFFRRYFRIPSDVLAWSTVVGGVLQAGILVPTLKRLGFVPRFRQWWGNPAVRRVLRSMGPSILGLSVMQLAVLINTHFASQLEEGSISWISWADRILEFPLALFAVSVGTAALPALSALWARGDREAMSEASLHALKLSLFMALPCAAALFVLAEPIVHTLYEHGLFSPRDTIMTAAVIRIYGLGVIFATGVRVLAPAFYAMKNTWLPALSAALALVFHVILASRLVKSYGVVGLATSSVFSSGINLFILIGAYQNLVGRLKVVPLSKSLFRFVLSSLVLALVASRHRYFEGLLGDSHSARVVSLAMVILLSGGAYLFTSWIIKTPELTETTHEFVRRIAGKLKRKPIAS